MKVFLLLMSTLAGLARAQHCMEQSDTLRQIRPSTVDRLNPNPPNITVDGSVYSSDAPHFVIPPTDEVSTANTILKVFLPGTTGSPADVSCLLSSIGSPTIGLSYVFLDSPDAARSHACAEHHGLGKAYQHCLTHQHVDAIWGGLSDSGVGIWQHIDRRDSIDGRLVLLLEDLHREYPNEGWDSFLQIVPGHVNMLSPLWDRIWIMGHSQGAGHAAYLARSTYLAGAGLLSGPQDDCFEAKHCWVADHWETRDVRVLAHAHEDAIDAIVDNWQLMDVFDDHSLTLIEQVNLHSSPTPGVPWLTAFEPQPGATCTRRPNHCSVAVDNNAPVSEAGVYLYSQHIWPRLAGMD
jgi:hypothetical protein